MSSSTPRRVRALAPLAAAVVLLTGCGGDPAATDTAPTTSSVPPSTSAPADAGTIPYVALGDSYTAAPLVPTTDPDDPCLRSSGNYPALVAAAMPALLLTDVSCSGADSAALVGAQTIGSSVALPQFDALSDATKVVTIGIGGNDFDFFESLLADCASSSDLSGSGSSGSGSGASDSGSPCTDAATGDRDLTALFPQLQHRLTAVLTGVKDRAPNADVIAVGYPQIFPTSGSCDLLPIAPGDYDYVRRLNEGLDDAVQAAAQATGVDFVDVYAASAGHDVCSADPWVNGGETDPGRALAFHPFAEEQQAVADLVVAQLEADGVGTSAA